MLELKKLFKSKVMSNGVNIYKYKGLTWQKK